MQLVVEAEKRDAKVRNITKKAVNGGFIPGVIYNKSLNVPIKFSRHDFEKVFSSLKSNSVVDVSIDGTIHKSLMQDYYEEASTRKIMHVDFYAIDFKKAVRVKIPVVVTGNCIGVKKGGIIQTFIRDMLVKCMPDNIPDSFEIDSTDLDIGSKVIVGDIVVAKDVEVLASKHEILLSVVASAKATSDASEKGDDTEEVKTADDSEASTEEKKSEKSE